MRLLTEHPALGCKGPTVSLLNGQNAASYPRINPAFVHRRVVKLNSSNGSVGPEDHIDEAILWKEGAFPQYLQESVEASDFCSILEEAKARQAGALGEENCAGSSVWKAIRREAERDAQAEPLLSSFLYASILSHDSFERSLAFVLSNRLSDATLLPTELFEVFYTILRTHKSVSESALADLCATRERDPACASYSQALLYFKGYHAIQVQRIAHQLWHAGRRVMALALQSRCSEVLAVDIHPAAKIGKGVLLDHGTGVVIGETAEIGNNVSILQNVTLGGTGKEHGDRHPKVSDNVLIGANATILGNIRIGKGAQVAAGSLVLKPVPPKTMVAGSPAKEVGHVSGNPALKMDQWSDDGKDALANGEVPCEDVFAPPKAAKIAHKPTKEKAILPSLEPKPTPVAREPEPVESSKATVAEAEEPKKPAAVSADPVHIGGPPAVAGPVEAVTSDSDAKKKWGKKSGEDVEYII